PRSRASSTITDLPAAAICLAAMRPERPAPTTSTSAFVRAGAAALLCGRRCLLLVLRWRRAASAAGAPARPPSTAPAAPVLMTVRRVYLESLIPLPTKRYRPRAGGVALAGA